MVGINTLIKEINNKLQGNEFNMAFELYSELLKDKHDNWKIKIIKNIIETIEGRILNLCLLRTMLIYLY